MNETMFSNDQIEIEQKTFITKVYGWMFVALVVTGIVAMYTASTPQLIKTIAGNKIIFFGLLIAELVLVGYLATAVAKMTAQRATWVFIGYSVLNGLTFSIIFLVYTEESIASTFLITALTFGVMSAYGYFTKKDLTSLGHFFMMGLVGLIIASVINIFFHNETLYLRKFLCWA